MKAAREFIVKELKSKKIIIVALLNMAEDVNELCYIDEVKYIYYHNIGSDLQEEDF